MDMNVQQQLVENAVAGFHQKAMRDWEAELEAEQERERERLNDPEYLASLGLPTEMPDESLDILKVTMAADKLGPKMPTLEAIYEKFNLG